MRRELLQLAETLEVKKHQIGGYYISEKLDGTRCFWDGGISRGVATEEVPWASVIDPKTGNRKKKIKPVATGLWSRYGNPIMAPDWWLNTLPACFLDGELWSGRGTFQSCRSICGGDTPDPRFDQIKYAVYSVPRFQDLFQEGEIKNSNMHCAIDEAACGDFIGYELESYEGDFLVSPAKNFAEEVAFMEKVFETQNKFCYPHKQEKLPLDLCQAHCRVAEYLDYVLEQGGEGVVLRDPLSCWKPKRHKGILKYKPFEDAEGTIIGFTAGRETNKGSRLLGKIGALIVRYKGKRLELAGLTDEEREIDNAAMRAWAEACPGKDIPPNDSKHFKIGQVVSFKYRELTDEGIPKEARFFRRRDAE
jgi:DNA ligase-1